MVAGRRRHFGSPGAAQRSGDLADGGCQLGCGAQTTAVFALLLAQASAQAVVFLSQDFLLFFLAWELELVPVYLLIAIWGGQRRQYAATKFILYTATASLLILISGLALAFHGDGFTLNLAELASRSYGGSFGLLCYLCLLYTSPSPRDQRGSRMPSSA